MKWAHKAVAIGALAIVGTLYGSRWLNEREMAASISEPAVKVAAESKVGATAPSLTLAERFKGERADLVARLNDTLKTKARYSVIFVAEEFQSVADAEFLDLLKRVRADQEKTAESLQKKFDAEDKKEARKKGVKVGMTREQVLASMWGKPQSVNTTTSAYGNREQWVYGSGNYLYFENGLLTTIQH